MRKIKFRGKVKGKCDWVYGSLLVYGDGEHNIHVPRKHNYKLDAWNVVPETVGQFTGLTDRNGKEIYEGDIITVNGRYPRVVLWDKMSWSLMPTKFYQDKYFWVMNLQHPGPDWWETFAGKFEVIGNIHDNPDLIPNQSTEV